MVIQGNWKSNEGAIHHSSSDDSNGSSQFQQPGKQSVFSVHSTPNMNTRSAITRQMSVNTLAALHRRFGLPSSVSAHARPSADLRASASKALDILRQTIQAAVTKEIDDVIKKYFQKFFIPAVNNIRTNLGEESVSEDQVRAVCRSMLDATRTLYAATPRAAASPGPEASDSESSNSADHCSGRVTDSSILNSMYSKRKESDTDSDTGGAWKHKKVKVEVISDELGTYHKWDPQRLKHDTLFIMGSHAHKVLGLGSSRGRLYTKHAGLLRYPADPADKEWIANHHLMHPVGGRTYIMVMEDIKELAASEHYRKSAMPLDELGGFRAPPFMLCKMKAFLEKKNSSDDLSLPPTPKTEHFPLITEIKSEIAESPSSNVTQYEEVKSEDNVWESERVGQVKYEIQSPDSNKNQYNNFIKTEFSEFQDEGNKQIKFEGQGQDKKRQYNFDFLDSWLPSMASEAGARNAIRHVTGANPDTISLANEEFDLGFSVSVPHLSRPATPNSKCITVESSAGGPVHSVPVARLQSHLAHAVSGQSQRPSMVGFVKGVAGSRAVQSQPGLHPHLPSISSISRAGHASGVAVYTGASHSSPSSCAPYKQLSSGNLLHNTTVARNMLNRSLHLVQSAGQAFQPTSASFSVTLESGTVPRITSTSVNTSLDNAVSTTREILETAHKSSAMLKRVLKLGCASSVQGAFDGVGAEHPLATADRVGAAQCVSAGDCSSTLMAAHATLSALLAGSKAAQHECREHN